MINILDIFDKLYISRNRADSTDRKAANAEFDTALDSADLTTGKLSEISNHAYSMAAAAEMQGFVAGFQMACGLRQLLNGGGSDA